MWILQNMSNPRPSSAFTHECTALRLKRPAAMKQVSEVWPEPPSQRPLRRYECRNGYRPCPWVTCAHHMFHALRKCLKGTTDPLDMEQTCVLDIAETGATLEEIAGWLGLTRERIRQIENNAMFYVKQYIRRRPF